MARIASGDILVGISLAGAQQKLNAGISKLRAVKDVSLSMNTRRFDAEYQAWVRRPRRDVQVGVRVDEKSFQNAERRVKQVQHTFEKSAFSKAVRIQVVVAGAALLPLLAQGALSAATALTELAQAALVLPGAFAGVGAIVGTLVTGLSGLGAAFSAAGKGSKKGAEFARDYAKASREMEKAQRDVSKALKDANRELEDQSQSLRETYLTQEQAAINVAKAKKTLRKGGFESGLDRRQAVLDVKTAIEDQIRVTREAGRTVADFYDAQAKGATGSDSFKDSVDRLVTAVEGFTKAGKEASGVTDEFLSAMASLSPKAQDLVTKVLSLRDAWKGLQFAVADAGLDGVGDVIVDLANKRLPQLQKSMEGTARSLNGVFKSVLGNLGSDKNAGFITKIFENTSKAIDTIKPGLNAFVNGLLHLSEVGSRFLPRISQAFNDLFDRFERFTNKADADGSLERWIDKGLSVIGSLVDAIGSVGSILNSVTEAYEAATGNIGGFATTLAGSLKKLATYLNTSSGRGSLVAYIKQGKEFVSTIADAVPGIFKAFAAFGDSARSFARIMYPIFSEIGKFLANNIRLTQVLFGLWFLKRTLTPIWRQAAKGWQAAENSAAKYRIEQDRIDRGKAALAGGFSRKGNIVDPLATQVKNARAQEIAAATQAEKRSAKAATAVDTLRAKEKELQQVQAIGAQKKTRIAGEDDKQWKARKANIQAARDAEKALAKETAVAQTTATKALQKSTTAANNLSIASNQVKEKFGQFKAAAADAAGPKGVGRLSSAIGRGANGLVGAIGSVAGTFGLIAVMTAAFTIFDKWQESNNKAADAVDRHKKAVDQLADSLDSVTGAATQATKDRITKNLQDAKNTGTGKDLGNVLNTLQAKGVDTSQLVDAIAKGDNAKVDQLLTPLRSEASAGVKDFVAKNGSGFGRYGINEDLLTRALSGDQSAVGEFKQKTALVKDNPGFNDFLHTLRINNAEDLLQIQNQLPGNVQSDFNALGAVRDQLNSIPQARAQNQQANYTANGPASFIPGVGNPFQAPGSLPADVAAAGNGTAVVSMDPALLGTPDKPTPLANNIRDNQGTFDVTDLTQDGKVQVTLPADRAAKYVQFKRDGGHVWGAGTATSDSIPAMLSNGEFVVNAKSAKAIGAQTLYAMNNAGKFAGGGLIGGGISGPVKKDPFAFTDLFGPKPNTSAAPLSVGNLPQFAQPSHQGLASIGAPQAPWGIGGAGTGPNPKPITPNSKIFGSGPGGPFGTNNVSNLGIGQGIKGIGPKSPMTDLLGPVTGALNIPFSPGALNTNGALRPPPPPPAPIRKPPPPPAATNAGSATPSGPGVTHSPDAPHHGATAGGANPLPGTGNYAPTPSSSGVFIPSLDQLDSYTPGAISGNVDLSGTGALPDTASTAASRAPSSGIPGANILGYLKSVAEGAGLRVGAGPSDAGLASALGVGTHSNDGALHTVNRALDIGNIDQAKSGGISEFVKQWESDPAKVAATRQLIFSGPDGNYGIINGRVLGPDEVQSVYGPWLGQHQDHVHLALEGVPGDALDPGASGVPVGDTSSGGGGGFLGRIKESLTDKFPFLGGGGGGGGADDGTTSDFDADGNFHPTLQGAIDSTIDFSKLIPKLGEIAMMFIGGFFGLDLSQITEPAGKIIDGISGLSGGEESDFIKDYDSGKLPGNEYGNAEKAKRVEQLIGEAKKAKAAGKPEEAQALLDTARREVSSGSGGGSYDPSTVAPSANYAGGDAATHGAVYQAFREAGFTDAEWPALVDLINGESSWRPEVQYSGPVNSDAYGLFQFLSTTWAGTGIEKTDDPYMQAVAGMRYIKNRYGSVTAANQFKHANNWYAGGGLVGRGLTDLPGLASASGTASSGPSNPVRRGGPGGTSTPFFSQLGSVMNYGAVGPTMMAGLNGQPILAPAPQQGEVANWRSLATMLGQPSTYRPLNESIEDLWKGIHTFDTVKGPIRQGYRDAMVNPSLPEGVAGDLRLHSGLADVQRSYAYGSNLGGSLFPDQVDNLSLAGAELARRAANATPTDSFYWRGAMHSPDELRAMEPGKVLDLPLSSFGKGIGRAGEGPPDTTRIFAGHGEDAPGDFGRWLRPRQEDAIMQGRSQGVVYKLAPGARGATVDPLDAESAFGGLFRVGDISPWRPGLPTQVNLEHLSIGDAAATRVQRFAPGVRPPGQRAIPDKNEFNYTAHHPETLDPMGSLSLTPNDTHLYVNMIKTGQQYRGMGGAKAMLGRAIEDHPGMALDPGILTDMGRGMAQHLIGANQDLASRALDPEQLRYVNGPPTGFAAGHARGGYISGPGGPTSDVIPAMLSDGEFVMRAKAVQHWGTGTLAAMNKFGDGGLAIGNGASLKLPFPIPGLSSGPTQPAGPLQLGPAATDVPVPAPAPTAPLTVGAAAAPGPGASGGPAVPGVAGPSSALASLPNPGALATSIGNAASGLAGTQPGAAPGPGEDGQADPRATLGAPEGRVEHLNPALKAGIEGAASAIGNAAGTAASLGISAAAPGAGGAAGSAIAAGAQIAGSAISGLANVVASLGVGTLDSTGKGYGAPLLPQQAAPTPVRSFQSVHNGDIVTNNLDQYTQQQRRMQAQDSAAFMNRVPV